jgi:hypothetical protein
VWLLPDFCHVRINISNRTKEARAVALLFRILFANMELKIWKSENLKIWKFEKLKNWKTWEKLRPHHCVADDFWDIHSFFRTRRNSRIDPIFWNVFVVIPDTATSMTLFFIRSDDITPFPMWFFGFPLPRPDNPWVKFSPFQRPLILRVAGVWWSSMDECGPEIVILCVSLPTMILFVWLWHYCRLHVADHGDNAQSALYFLYCGQLLFRNMSKFSVLDAFDVIRHSHRFHLNWVRNSCALNPIHFGFFHCDHSLFRVASHSSMDRNFHLSFCFLVCMHRVIYVRCERFELRANKPTKRCPQWWQYGSFAIHFMKESFHGQTLSRDVRESERRALPTDDESYWEGPYF